MQIIIKHFPFEIDSIKSTLASALYINVWEIIRDAEVFIQYHGEDSAYGLGTDGSLTGYYLPEEGVVCEVVINNESKNLKTADLIQLDYAFKLREIMENFLARLEIPKFSMEFKIVEE